jgi:PKD repeat protein
MPAPPKGPVAKFVAPASAITGEPATFVDQSTVTGGNIVSRVWTFGDDTPALSATTTTVTHTYATAGAFDVQLSVTDNKGRSSLAVNGVLVNDPAPAPLTIADPNDVAVASPDGQPVLVTFSLPTPTGGVPPYTVVATPASGSAFPLGVTAVTVVASDAVGDSVLVGFDVVVAETLQPPTNLAASVTEAEVALTWTAPQSFQTDLHVIRDGSLRAILPKDAAAHTDDEVPDGRHVYHVDAVAASLVAASESVTVTVGGQTPDLKPATDLAATVSGATVTLTWVPADSFQTSQRVLRNESAVAELAPTAASHTDAALPPGTYVYEIETVAGNQTAPSTTVTVTITDAPLLQAPTDLTANVAGPDVALSWTPPQSFQTELHVVRDGTLLVILGPQIATHTDEDVPAGTHVYHVDAIAGSAVAASSAVTVSVQAPPLAVTGLAAAAVGQTVTLIWMLPVIQTQTELRIVRNGTPIATVGPTVTRYNDLGVVVGTHSYRVDSSNASGTTSSASVSVTVTGGTVPGAFTDIHAADLAPRGIFGLPPYSEVGFEGPDLGFSDGTITGLRIADGRVFLFLLGDVTHQSHLHMIQVPQTLATTLAEAVAYVPPGPFGGQQSAGVRAVYARSFGDASIRPDGQTARQYRNMGAGNLCGHWGLQFLPGTTTLIVTYADTYQVIGGDPCFFLTTLDLSTGAHVAAGPWRYNVPTKLLNGYVVTFEADVADQYLNGRRIAFGGHTSSGAAGSPFGPYLRPVEIPPMTRPPDSTFGTDSSVTADAPLFGWTATNPMPIPVPLQRKMCWWKDPGDKHAQLMGDLAPNATEVPVSDTSIFCRPTTDTQNGSESRSTPGLFIGHFGDTIGDGSHSFFYTGRSTTTGAGMLTGVSGVTRGYAAGVKVQLEQYDDLRGGATGEAPNTFGPGIATINDYVSAACVMQTTDGRACVVFGAQVAHSRPGEFYADGTVHAGYGPALCPHGDRDYHHQATGPYAKTRRPCLIFFSLNDVLAVARGELSATAIQPIDWVWASDWWSELPADATAAGGSISGLWFDSDLRGGPNDLYLSVNMCDGHANPNSPRAAIFVVRLT